MMDFIQANLSTVIWWVVAALLAVGAFSYRSTLEFWLNHWKYTFPVLGKTARLSRHGIHGQGGWTDSERTLCGDYNKFISYLSKAEFSKRNEYLAKADDSGRSPTPLWLMVLLTVLVIAEGLGFSYLLGSWMARDGSANTHTLLMVAIVLVICVIMVFLTHVAGHQLYRSNLVARCRKQWRQDKTQERFSSRKVKLDEDQSVDDGEPDYTQVANRVGTSHSYFMVGLAVVVILAIAVTSTCMRWSNLNAEQTREAMGVGVSQSADAGNPFANGNAVPTELVASQKAADDRARAEESSSTRSEGAAAFITLAIIFVVTQIVGIFGGFAWGFGGRESRAAWKTTKGFTTFEDYNNYYAPLRSIAQSQLENLQKRMAENADISGKTFSKTFRDYVLEQRALSDLDADPVRTQSVQASTGVASERPVNKEVAAPASPGVADTIATHAVAHEVANASIDSIVSEIEGTSDVTRKKELIYGLAEPVRTQVINEIKARKERAEQAKNALESQLDDLFKV